MDSTHKYKIGIVDEETVWVEIFKRKFKEAFDVYVFDLNSDTEIKDIISKIEDEKVECIIADYELNETAIVKFNGDKLVDAIKAKYPYFPVFIITGQNEDYVISQVEDNDIVRDKSEINDKTETLINRIKNKINNYYRQIEEAKNTIKELVEKKNSVKGLSVAEEETLTEKYMFLEKINPEEKILPDNLIQPESITKLNELVSDTKQILEELKKINK